MEDKKLPDGVDEVFNFEIPEKEAKKEEKEDKKESPKKEPSQNPQDKENRKKLDAWARQAIPVLNTYGYLDDLKSKEVGTIHKQKKFIFLITSLAIIMLGFFIFFGFHGNFKSSFVDNSNSTCINNPSAVTCPSLSCPTQNITLVVPENLNIHGVNINITNSS